MSGLKFVGEIDLVRSSWGYSNFCVRLTYEYLVLQKKKGEFSVGGNITIAGG